MGQAREGICGRPHIGKGNRDSQLVAFSERTGYLQTVCDLPCPGTARTAPFHALKIPVQTPSSPDTNAYLHP